MAPRAENSVFGPYQTENGPGAGPTAAAKAAEFARTVP